ncbi:MAG: FecR domain-containing protein [Bacteroidota bacterium]
MPEEYVLIRYHEGTVSPEEKALVESWLNASEEHQTEFEQLLKIWNHSAEAAFFDQIDVQGDWQKVKAQATSTGRIRTLSSPPVWKKYRWVAAAAVVLLLVVAGIRFWPAEVETADWQLAERISSTDPRMLTLPDGSQVWLNVDSRLSYPLQFDENERFVKLEGEAFFDVASNADQPFIIETARSKVKVLGTAFRLEAYEEMGEVRLQLEEGRVEFSAKRPGGGSLILVEGEQARINLEGNIEKIEEPIAGLPAWKSGHFRFHETPLYLLLRELQSYYECTFEWREGAIGKQCLVSIVWQEEQLEELLEELAATVDLAYDIERNKIWIDGAKCSGH